MYASLTQLALGAVWPWTALVPLKRHILQCQCPPGIFTVGISTQVHSLYTGVVYRMDHCTGHLSPSLSTWFHEVLGTCLETQKTLGSYQSNFRNTQSGIWGSKELKRRKPRRHKYQFQGFSRVNTDNYSGHVAYMPDDRHAHQTTPFFVQLVLLWGTVLQMKCLNCHSNKGFVIMKWEWLFSCMSVFSL